MESQPLSIRAWRTFLAAFLLAASPLGAAITNGDFETGNFTGWTPYWSNSQGYQCESALVVGPAPAPNTAGALNRVHAGNYSAEITSGPCATNDKGQQYVGIKQTALVAPGQDCFCFWMAAVVVAGGHNTGEDAYVNLSVTVGASLIYFQHWEYNTYGGGLIDDGVSGYKHLPWTQFCFDLQPYSGQSLTIDVRAHNCIFDGHSATAYVDDFEYGNCPPPTPTPTFSITRTFTLTRTPTRSPTITRTSTTSPTPTRTPSFTYSPTVTPTFTASPTYTATLTHTPTSTPTFTFTHTLTRSPTPTGTPTATSTVTFTPTGTYSATPTASPSATQTITFTQSATRTQTPTATPSGTQTVTFTASPTLTDLSTPTSTFTGTVTFTPSPSRTATASFTPTGSSTSTLTGTATYTATRSATATASQTVSFSPSPTSTNSPTPTPSGTGTSTLTATRTSTATPTWTPTYTPTPSSTPSGTQTLTFSATASHTPSLSPSVTPSITQTFTITPTFTPELDFQIISVYPNPIGPKGASILVEVPFPSNVTLQIFNIRGELVWDWQVPCPAAGFQTIFWDANSRFGKEVTFGSYYLLARAEATTSKRWRKQGRWISVVR